MSKESACEKRGRYLNVSARRLSKASKALDSVCEMAHDRHFAFREDDVEQLIAQLRRQIAAIEADFRVSENLVVMDVAPEDRLRP